MPNTFIDCLTRDPAGGLWVGTDDGVARYDGKKFTTLLTRRDGLLPSWVSAILPETNGVLWIATVSSGVGGVTRYDPAGKDEKDPSPQGG